MDERAPLSNEPQASELTNFVLNNVSSYEDLNAGTLQEGQEKFGTAIKTALEASQAGERLGDGVFNEVYALQDGRVAVKVLKAEDYNDAKLERVWTKIQREHQTVLGYLGKEFVPDTEFAVINQNFGSSTEPPSQQYVAVQERMSGQKLENAHGQIPTSPELKAQAAEYIRRYEKMMRDGITMDHPDDLMINDTPDATRRIAILDTNNLISFTDMVNGRNNTVFLQEYGIDPASIKTPEDVVQILRNIVPSIAGLDAQEKETLQNQDYPTLMSRLRQDGNLLPRLQDSLRRVPSNLESVPATLRNNPFLDRLLSSGFEGLAACADRFAPEGQHPRDITVVMNKLGISDADLQQYAP